MAEANAGVANGSSGGLTDGLIGMLNAFIDPAATAKRVPAKLFWLWPVITLIIIYVVFSTLLLPYTVQLVDARISQTMLQRGVPPDQIERAQHMAESFSRFTGLATPAIVIGVIALLAWLVALTGSMVGLRAKFRDVFCLMAACSLIPALQYAADYIVVKTKGDEIQTPEQLTPPFGIDIFFPGAHGAFYAFLNFFSIFEIWYLVVLVFGLAYLAGSSKGKAFAAITPAWVLPLLFRIIGAAFSGAGGS
jgi:hypothetical protein